MPDFLDSHMRSIARALVADAPPPPSFPLQAPIHRESRAARGRLVALAALILIVGTVVTYGLLRSNGDPSGVSVGGNDDPNAPGRATTPAPVSAAHECTAPPDSVNDVATEPDWRSYADYREWTTSDGCLIRIDVLGDRPGPDHCGWSSARVLVTGNPVGNRYTSPSDDLTFVRDPGGVFGRPELVDGLQEHTALPANAIDTGFRSGATELWVVAGDLSAVFVKSDGGVERWPEGQTPLCL